MTKLQGKQRWLALMVTAYLLSGATGAVWAAPITVSTNKMVNTGNNNSSAIQAYDSIHVTQDSTDSAIVVDGKTVYLGIGNDGTGNQPLNVYLTTVNSGNYTVVVSNDGSAGTGRVMAGGVGSLSAQATTNIYGPLTVQVTAAGSGSGKASAMAMGIGVSEGALTTEKATITVSATGGTDLGSATADAKGITAGGASTPAVVNVGTATGINTIAVSATGGKASGGAANTGNVGAQAYGIENYENSTINLLGTTNISESATGGQPLAAGNVAKTSTADAYGIYNSMGVVNADKLVMTSITANGKVGQSTQGTAVGVFATGGGTVNINELTISELIAKGGQAVAGGYYASAGAYGVQINTGSVTVTDAFNINVQARGGTSDNQALASAAGLINGDTVNAEATLKLGKTGGTNTVTVAATGGFSSGSDEENNMAAEAFGLYNNAATTLQGTTTFAVTATGGQRFEAGNTVGDASAKAHGIYNQGAVLNTENLTFANIYATGKTGADTFAEAYGIYNTDNNAVLTLGNLAFTDIQAEAGNSSDSGTAYATAAAVWDESGTMNAGTITGTVTAKGGSGPNADTEAYGIKNGSAAITAASLAFNVTAQAGTGSEEATATAKAVENGGTLLTGSGGANNLTAKAYGGKSASTDETGNVAAFAYGIHNRNQIDMSGGATTFTVTATGGSPAAASGGDVYMAGDAYAEAYGIYNEGTTMEMGNLTFTEVTANGGVG